MGPTQSSSEAVEVIIGCEESERRPLIGVDADQEWYIVLSSRLERKTRQLGKHPSVGDGPRVEALREDLEGLCEQVSRYGYYGVERLLKAAIKKFADHCASEGITLESKNFAIRAESSIPRQVGLGGSSAIVTAAMRCLMEFYGIDIPVEILPSLTLDAEAEELGINAGLQDRVIQAYEGCYK